MIESMNKPNIIVNSRKRDTKTIGVQKYDNAGPGAEWNVEGGLAPNGVCATRWQRTIAPDLSQLSPLAVFLVTAGNGINVAGLMPHSRHECQIVCYNGRTEAEQIMWRAEHGGLNIPESLRVAQIKKAQATLKMYEGFLDRPQKIDLLFDIIEPEESDESYINRFAARMIAAGVTRVTIGDAEWRA